jgi:hypothetical protein
MDGEAGFARTKKVNGDGKMTYKMTKNMRE